MDTTQTNPRRLASIALAAFVALTALAATALPARAANSGLNLRGDWAAPAAIADVQALHPAWVRIFLGWYAVEPRRGVIDTSQLDYLARGFSELPAGTKIVVDVVGTPAWATADGSTNVASPPRHVSDYARFVAALAQRFKGVVEAWEIWNEEDSNPYWLGTVPEFVALLRAAYPAIKAADPNAQVVIGGLVGNNSGFLSALYDAGARGSFDTVALHTDTGCLTRAPGDYVRDPNGQINRYSFLAYRGVRLVMVAHGDGAKRILMTEFGWDATASICNQGGFAGQKPAGVSEADQASNLLAAYHCLAQDSYIEGAIWFQYRDQNSGPYDHMGLLRVDGSRRPVFDAFQSYTTNGDQLTSPCGNFTGPLITILKPTTQSRYAGPLLIDVSATSPAGVRRLTLLCDGKKIRNFTDASAPTILSGKINWMGAKHLALGSHTIVVQALDPQRNVSQVSVVVLHVLATSSRATHGSHHTTTTGKHKPKHKPKPKPKHKPKPRKHH